MNVLRYVKNWFIVNYLIRNAYTGGHGHEC